MNTLIDLFCNVDDFCQSFLPVFHQQLISAGEKQRNRLGKLCDSEVMTLLIHFHQSCYRNFKHYYTEYVEVHLQDYFPELPCYARFVSLMARVLLPLTYYLESRKGQCTGLSFIDSTPLQVCHNLRIKRNKVFAGVAGRGKSSTGWFYGLKLHLAINECGDYLGCMITPGNIDDRAPVNTITKSLTGKLFGDKGYLSKKLFATLIDRGLKLITTVRRNMQNKLMPLIDRIILRKRFIIETVNDQLKNISQIEHTRHRSVMNCLVNIICGIIAYTHQPKKPTLNLSSKQLTLIRN